MPYPTCARFALLVLPSSEKPKSCLFFLCISCLLFVHPGEAKSAEAFSVDATRAGNAVEIKARATVRAPLSLIWNTLTDYDHLASFIPGMNRSRLLEKRGKINIVEQSGYARIWFFRYPIEVTVETVEQAPYDIRVYLLSGNLRRLEGGYRIEKTGEKDTYTLRWSGVIEPGMSIPGAIATPLMRENISKQFLGMVDEIDRRSSLKARD